MTDLILAKQSLTAGEYTCVLCKGNKIHTSSLRGVKPLVIWLSSDEDFGGFSAADKVIGKATAFLYARLGVKAVYASVISEGALKVLLKYGIHAEYDRLVEYIVNHQRDGMCPFEAAVWNIEDADAAYAAIRRKMDDLRILF